MRRPADITSALSRTIDDPACAANRMRGAKPMGWIYGPSDSICHDLQGSRGVLTQPLRDRRGGNARPLLSIFSNPSDFRFDASGLLRAGPGIRGVFQSVRPNWGSGWRPLRQRTGQYWIMRSLPYPCSSQGPMLASAPKTITWSHFLRKIAVRPRLREGRLFPENALVSRS